MLLIALEYLFNLGFYAVTVYLALLLMEKIGKKRPGTWKDRTVMSVVLSAGATMFQLIVHAITLVYSASLAGP